MQTTAENRVASPQMKNKIKITIIITIIKTKTKKKPAGRVETRGCWSMTFGHQVDK